MPDTEGPQPDSPFSPNHEHTYVDDKGTTRTGPSRQSSTQPTQNAPGTSNDLNPRAGRVQASTKQQRPNSVNPGDTVKEVTIWWHVDATSHETLHSNMPDTVTVTSFPTSLALLKQRVCAEKGLDDKIFYIVAHYQKQRQIDAGMPTIGITMQCRGFGGARISHNPGKGHPSGVQALDGRQGGSQHSERLRHEKNPHSPIGKVALQIRGQRLQEAIGGVTNGSGSISHAEDSSADADCGTPQLNALLRETESERKVDTETLPEGRPTRQRTPPWPSGHITHRSAHKLHHMPIRRRQYKSSAARSVTSGISRKCKPPTGGHQERPSLYH